MRIRPRSTTPDPAIKQDDLHFDEFVVSVEDGSPCMKLSPQPTPTTAVYMNENGDWWIEQTDLWKRLTGPKPWPMTHGERMGAYWFEHQPWDPEEQAHTIDCSGCGSAMIADTPEGNGQLCDSCDPPKPTDPVYADGYRQCAQDLADLMYELAGTSGPRGPEFTTEAEAGVRCVAYLLKYGHFDEAQLIVYSGDTEPPKTLADLIRLDLLQTEEQA